MITETQTVTLIPSSLTKINTKMNRIPQNIKQIGVKEKWKKGYSGQHIVIAVIDTGCEMNHPDLRNAIIDGYNFTSEHNGDVRNYIDDNGHGTHIAGIIAASHNENGLVGVSFNAKLLILKILDQDGNGSIESLIHALYYAEKWVGPNNERVRVVTLSLGTKHSSPALYTAIKRAIDSDISVVVASGNDGDGNINTNEYRYPGAYKEVIEVGAVDEKQRLARFSNTNEHVDIYAPGVNIHSTYLKDGYAELSGTSMAAPHVAGAIALLLQEYELKLGRKLSPDEIYEKLMEHTHSPMSKENRLQILDLSK
ncbi:S8 family peptidase [Priestia koreensis]|uniref:S8 family peptidase n=1 Tax=Priestia koreensis TaxID=284581 RepID=UPI00203F3BDF|nr:S8 family peptidase [Priestia koreensis]MCM3006827.1 S8 family peptidase [Priestia koreensis]